MRTRDRKYLTIKRNYLKLFATVDDYLRVHPEAILEFDESRNNGSVGLGFYHRDGPLKVSTYFELPERSS
jgi:hypothetical protein